MDLDNINDIEVLREAAKSGRARLLKSVGAEGSEFVFRKGLWYLIEQDEDGVTMYSEHYIHKVTIPYRLADEYFIRV